MLRRFAMIFICLVAGLPRGMPEAAELRRPGPVEVVEEVSRFTGLAKDVVSLVRQQNAKLFEDVDHTVFAVKLISLVYEARDEDAAAAFATKALEMGLDKVKERLLPGALNGFLTFASAYKAALEIIRDYIVIPKFDDRIYQAYKSSRAADARFGDVSPESIENAFSLATMQRNSGYFVVKEKMYDDMLRARKMNKDLVGPELEKGLRRKIDNYWMHRLEVRYQRELLQTQRDRVVADTWKKADKAIAAIRAAAFGLGGNEPERFFLAAKDIPKGWRKIGQSKEDFKVRANPSSGEKFQSFTIVNLAFTSRMTEKKYANGDEYFQLPGTSSQAMPSRMHITVNIQPRLRKLNPEFTFDFREHLERDVQSGKVGGEPLAIRLQPSVAKVGGCSVREDNTNRRIVCQFVKGSWRVQVEGGSMSSQRLRESQQREVARHKGAVRPYVEQTVVPESLVLAFVEMVAVRIPEPN